jgi:hypothetical protein
LPTIAVSIPPQVQRILHEGQLPPVESRLKTQTHQILLKEISNKTYAYDAISRRVFKGVTEEGKPQEVTRYGWDGDMCV